MAAEALVKQLRSALNLWTISSLLRRIATVTLRGVYLAVFLSFSDRSGSNGYQSTSRRPVSFMSLAEKFLPLRLPLNHLALLVTSISSFSKSSDLLDAHCGVRSTEGIDIRFAYPTLNEIGQVKL
jgi:hypothetical protein